MKKIIALVVLFILAIVLIGIFRKRTEVLKCTYGGQDNSKAEYIQTFHNGVSKENAKLKFTFDFTSLSEEDYNKLENQDLCSTLINGIFSGIENCHQILEDDRLIAIDGDYNIQKVISTDTEKQKNYSFDMERVKKYLETVNFSCRTE